jgi:hypothetical protein
MLPEAQERVRMTWGSTIRANALRRLFRASFRAAAFYRGQAALNCLRRAWQSIKFLGWVRVFDLRGVAPSQAAPVSVGAESLAECGPQAKSIPFQAKPTHTLPDSNAHRQSSVACV